MIELDGADVEIGGRLVLRDLRWRLAPDQHWGVLGANGSGKSAFLALLAGIRWPAPGRGVRRYDFGRGVEHDAVEARRKITLLGPELQNLYASRGWSFKARDVLLSGISRTDVPRARATPDEAKRAGALLGDLGLAHLADRPFLELSRGEQRLVLIARSIAFRPRLLLLDEPAAGLDPHARHRIHTLLARAAARTQLMVSAHSAENLPAPITHILRIEAGRIVESGVRPLEPPAHARRTGGAPKASRAASGRRLDAGSHIVAREEHAADGQSLIELHKVDVWLGGRCVLHGITWRLGPGEHWRIRGANGAGKSSFLRLLHGQLRPARGGSIRWPALGDPASVWSLRRLVAWVSPELQANYRYRVTVRECVASGFDSSLGVTRLLAPGERERVELLLDRFDLLPLHGRLLTELSYGQGRRVLLARALVNRPRVLLLDEPWEGLDRASAALLESCLEASPAEGTQLVCVTHTRGARCTHELVLDQGAVSASGPRASSRPGCALDAHAAGVG